MTQRFTIESNIISYSKGMIATAVGLFLCCAGISNMIDHDTNYQLVQHVLSMTPMRPWFATTLVDARSVISPILHTTMYLIIIFTEILSGLTCVAGGLCLMTTKKKPDDNLRKNPLYCRSKPCISLILFRFLCGGW